MTVHVLLIILMTSTSGSKTILGYWDIIRAWKIGKRSTAKDRLHDTGHTSALHLGPRMMRLPDRPSIPPRGRAGVFDNRCRRATEIEHVGHDTEEDNAMMLLLPVQRILL
jgi:hypothetical protein